MRRVKVIISLLLLSLFTAYQVSITMFTHVHYVNGVLVVHSHPFSNEHTHSQTELVVIDRLSDYHTIEPLSVTYVPTFELLYRSLDVETIASDTFCGDVRVPSLRAPPLFFAVS